MSAVAILNRMFSAARHSGQFRRLLFEENGQDVVEYALLTAFIGFAGAAVWEAMRTSLGDLYTNISASVWNRWEPDDPAGGGS